MKTIYGKTDLQSAVAMIKRHISDATVWYNATGDEDVKLFIDKLENTKEDLNDLICFIMKINRKRD